MDDVRVHRDSPHPAAIEALAGTQDRDIDLGPGQKKHPPHQAWHVVQQKQGRVKPTLQVEGALINDGVWLEGEAGDRRATVQRGRAADQRPSRRMRQPNGPFAANSFIGRASATYPRQAPARASPLVIQRYPNVDPAVLENDRAEQVKCDANGDYPKNSNAMYLSDVPATFSGTLQYVVTQGGTMIVGSRGAGYAHPSLIGGVDPAVSAAGEIGFYKGSPWAINTKSGHYKPPESTLFIAHAAIMSQFPRLGYTILQGGPTFNFGTLAPSRMAELSPTVRTDTLEREEKDSQASQDAQTLTVGIGIVRFGAPNEAAPTNP